MYLDGEYQLLLFLPYDMWFWHTRRACNSATWRRQSLPDVIFDSCTHGKTVSYVERLELEPEVASRGDLLYIIILHKKSYQQLVSQAAFRLTNS
jgi:hypothetical protein